VTRNTIYALRLANTRAADRPAGGWPPEGLIIMTPYRPPDDHPLSVCLIMRSTFMFNLRPKAATVNVFPDINLPWLAGQTAEADAKVEGLWTSSPGFPQNHGGSVPEGLFRRLFSGGYFPEGLFQRFCSRGSVADGVFQRVCSEGSAPECLDCRVCSEEFVPKSLVLEGLFERVCLGGSITEDLFRRVGAVGSGPEGLFQKVLFKRVCYRGPVLDDLFQRVSSRVSPLEVLDQRVCSGASVT
jgi:hypothetical protein